MNFKVIKKASSSNIVTPDSLEDLRLLLEQVVQQMVDDGRSIQIIMKPGPVTMTFYIKCPANSLGQILGSKGRNINSLRCIALAMCARRGVRCIVEVPYYEERSLSKGKVDE